MAPDISCIHWKKQLELLEAKQAMQAEDLRQVRAESGSEGAGRPWVWAEAGLAQESGEGWVCSPLGAPPV